MQRRAWLAAVMLGVAGCSSSTSRSRKSRAVGKRPKGPQTMGNLLLDSYIGDLSEKAPTAKRIKAAQELGNMGSSAKKALPTLKKMAGDKNGQVSAAAKAAIAAIGR